MTEGMTMFDVLQDLNALRVVIADQQEDFFFYSKIPPISQEHYDNAAYRSHAMLCLACELISRIEKTIEYEEKLNAKEDDHVRQCSPNEE